MFCSLENIEFTFCSFSEMPPRDKVWKARWRKMQTITISQIEERLRQLPADKLEVVFDFVSYLAERQLTSDSFQTMLASEAVLRRDWERPEEEAAWAHL